MIAGTIVGVQRFADGRTRLVVESVDGESTVDVYSTEWVEPGCTVWSQGGLVMVNGRTFPPDTKMWMIREDWDGYRWSLEEAKQGGRKVQG